MVWKFGFDNLTTKKYGRQKPFIVAHNQKSIFDTYKEWPLIEMLTILSGIILITYFFQALVTNVNGAQI